MTEQLQHHKDADTALEVFADGLDAIGDGRGFGKDHLKARQDITAAFIERDRLKTVNPELLAALGCAVRDLSATYAALETGRPAVSIGQFARLDKMRAVLAKAKENQP